MDTLEALRRRIDSAHDLQSVVRTMKALAAVGVQQFQRAAESLDDYYRTVELGLQIAMRERPEAFEVVGPVEGGRTGAVVIGSDQGMCGQFNAHIAEHAASELNAKGIAPADRALLALGIRVVPPLETAGQQVERTFAVPSSPTGITPLVTRILLTVEEWQSERNVRHVLVFHNDALTSASYEPTSHQLLPVDAGWLDDLAARPWPARTLPTFTVEWRQLLSSLIRQYLLVSLYRAVVNSLAAENASRMASMQSAERNIEDRLRELQAGFNHRRQTRINEELLDIVGGFEALTTAPA